MKIRFILLSIVISVIVSSLVIGCITIRTSVKPTITPTKSAIEEIKITSSAAGPNKANFYGTSTLPDGTILRSQLYLEYDNPEAWWPVDKDIVIKDGKWKIEVQPDEYGGSLKVGPGYRFKIWAKDKPAIAVHIGIDLVGPPPEPSSTP